MKPTALGLHFKLLCALVTMVPLCAFGFESGKTVLRLPTLKGLPAFEKVAKNPSLTPLSRPKILLNSPIEPKLAKPMARGGGSGVGGGGGFVRVSSVDRRGVDLVWSLDRWELQFRAPVIEIGANEEPVDYLTRVLKHRLTSLDAVLLRVLLESIDQVQAAPWRDVGRMAKLEDQGHVLGDPNSAGLTPVQIILRHSSFKSGFKSDISFDYDKELFQHLAKFDQALLVLHEAIYVMAADLGHVNSDCVRELTAFLLQQSEEIMYPSSFKTGEFRAFLKRLRMASFTELYEAEYASNPSTSRLIHKQDMFKTTIRLINSPYRPEKMTNEEAFYHAWWFTPSMKTTPRLSTLEQYVASPNDEPEMEDATCWYIRQQDSLEYRKAQKHCKEIERRRLQNGASPN